MDTSLETGLEQAVQIIREVDFPTLPLYLQLIQKEIQLKNPSFKKIAEYVSQDIALTAKLLQRVNSAAFRPKYKIDTVLQALTTLGLDEFYNSIITVAIKNELNRHYLSTESFNIFWKHSTKTATACQFLAKRLNEYGDLDFIINENHAYLTGLFHDSGIPIMAARFPEYEKSMENASRENETLINMEKRLFRTDHSIVCHIIGKMWELPESVYCAMYCHSEPDLGYYTNQTHKQLSLILRMAESFVYDMNTLKPDNHIMISDAFPVSEIFPMIQKEFGLDIEMLEELYAELEGFLTN